MMLPHARKATPRRSWGVAVVALLCLGAVAGCAWLQPGAGAWPPDALPSDSLPSVPGRWITGDEVLVLDRNGSAMFEVRQADGQVQSRMGDGTWEQDGPAVTVRLRYTNSYARWQPPFVIQLRRVPTGLRRVEIEGSRGLFRRMAAE